MNQSIKLNTKQAKPFVEPTFPDYKGRKFQIEFAENVMLYNTNWSGGTRNKYAALAADGRMARPDIPAPWINQVEGSEVELNPNVVLVKHTIFCGKDLGITIYVHPSYAPQYLPEGKNS